MKKLLLAIIFCVIPSLADDPSGSFVKFGVTGNGEKEFAQRLNATT